MAAERAIKTEFPIIIPFTSERTGNRKNKNNTKGNKKTFHLEEKVNTEERVSLFLSAQVAHLSIRDFHLWQDKHNFYLQKNGFQN